MPAPSVSHGQSLLWSGLASATGIQGVTEFIECERAKDDWLKAFKTNFELSNCQPVSNTC